MSSTKFYDIAVIGAGISGLSFANHLAKAGKKVLILEASPKIGGCLQTRYKNDFWIEMGAHTFYSTYLNVLQLIEKNDLDKELVARQKVGMKVFDKTHERIASKINKLELLTSFPKLFFLKREGKTVREYFGNIVGKKNYSKLFSHLFDAVIVQNADQFSAQYFLKKRKHRNKKYPRSFVLKKGMSEFTKSLINHENITVKTNCKLENLEKTEFSFALKSAQKKYFANDVALACSPQENAKLVKTINHELSNVFAEFPLQNIVSKSIILQKNEVKIENMAFSIPLKTACFSMTTRDVFPHEKWRGFSFHFEANKMTNEQQIELMSSLLNLSELDHEIQECKHQLPLLKLGHAERISKMEFLIKKAGIYVTGNYFNGLSLEDCVQRSKEEFERYFRNSG